jgi:hypothetical protein
MHIDRGGAKAVGIGDPSVTDDSTVTNSGCS